MEECGKYLKNVLIGLIILALIPFMPKFNGYWGIGIILIFIFGVYALWLIMPYLRCLSRNNDKLKPPF